MNMPTATIVKIFFSFALGMTALVVSFVAGSVFEVPGENSIRENVAACLVGAAFMAFCQFWVAPRGSRRFGPKWPTLVAMVSPLFLMLPFIDPGAVLPTGIPVLVSGCLGCLVGAVIAGRVGSRPVVEVPSIEGHSRLGNGRLSLLLGVALLVGTVLLVGVGVIPPLMTERAYATGFKAHGFAGVLGVAAALHVFVAVTIAFAAYRPNARNHFWRLFLGVPAVLALLFALLFAFASAVMRSEHPALLTASIVVMLCAVADLVAAGLLTAASVLAGGASVAGD